MNSYYLHMVSNWTGGVLYTGVTNNLERRIYEHKNKMIKGFSSKYNTSKLVYLEKYGSIQMAIEREKQIKKWSRHKKEFLINSLNPNWNDLSVEWYEYPSTTLGMTGGNNSK